MSTYVFFNHLRKPFWLICRAKDKQVIIERVIDLDTYEVDRTNKTKSTKIKRAVLCLTTGQYNLGNGSYTGKLSKRALEQAVLTNASQFFSQAETELCFDVMRYPASRCYKARHSRYLWAAIPSSRIDTQLDLPIGLKIKHKVVTIPSIMIANALLLLSQQLKINDSRVFLVIIETGLLLVHIKKYRINLLTEISCSHNFASGQQIYADDLATTIMQHQASQPAQPAFDLSIAGKYHLVSYDHDLLCVLGKAPIVEAEDVSCLLNKLLYVTDKHSLFTGLLAAQISLMLLGTISTY